MTIPHNTMGGTSDHSSRRSWVVSVYDVSTDALVAEYSVEGVNGATVRALWMLGADDPPRPLLVTSDQLAFVNEHLMEPVAPKAGEEIYLEEFSD
jgi:hypothetical protein